MSDSAEDRHVFSLDDEEALDPQRAGAKAAWLARGRRAGLPVLDGAVVDASVSADYIELGAATLESASSGAARLAVSTASPPDCIDQLELSAAHMSAPLVARSSSLLEGSGEWSGAFTSYLDLSHGELGIGVLGCWASVFTAATLERFAASDRDASRTRMAVLVQPAMLTDFGGTARIAGRQVEVVAVKGSPAPLVQGWEPGVSAKIDDQGVVSGAAATDLIGEPLIQRVAALMRDANAKTGATACEWGSADGDLAIFQLAKPPPPPAAVAVHASHAYESHIADRVAALVRRYPGPIGEAFVLPWAIAFDQPPTAVVAASAAPAALLVHIRQMADALTASAWRTPKASAKPTAQQTLRMLRSHDLEDALGRIAGLHEPDAAQAAHLIALIEYAGARCVEAGTIGHPEHVWWLEPQQLAAVLQGDPPPMRDRFGYDRWEPFTAAVVSVQGTSTTGAAASPGLGAGRVCRVFGTDDMLTFRSRDVVLSTHPVPNLAPLLWDAAAVVTTGGSPAAHLFESARALGIPAVAGVRLEELGKGDRLAGDGELVMAVDGASGVVSVQDW